MIGYDNDIFIDVILKNNHCIIKEGLNILIT